MDNKSNSIYKKAFLAAFPKTIPVMEGFSFLGMAYGIYMNVSGFSFVYPMIMSIVIFGGSLEFVTVTMLLGAFAPLQAFLAAVMIQARHLFYGIAMLDRFKNQGIKKLYLIYAMCDETFSVNYSAIIPKDVDDGWFMFFVSLLNQIYWVLGATIGGLVGSLLTIDTKGIDFVMTAMFVVIFLDQFLKDKQHYSAVIGVIMSIICLYIFGADSFLIPTMICIVVLLTIFRKPIEGAGGIK